MKILLTGSSGLIGRNLVPELVSQGHNVEILLGSDGNKIDFTQSWNFDSVLEVPDCIIHLAQSPNFRNFPESSLETFQVNTLSTLILVNWAVKMGVSKFIYTSSAGVYGFGDSKRMESETICFKDSLGFYLSTKYCSELILNNFNMLINIVQLRLFFVYGKNQRSDMLIPRLIENIKLGKLITCHPTKSMLTNPTHVSDCVNAIIASLAIANNEVINIAGPETISLYDMVNVISNKLGIAPNINSVDLEVNHLIPDLTKMNRLLGKSSIKFDSGVNDLLD